ncbi:MAG TPA: amidase [Vicinamibacterales bacterium]|nr:amidase [Vicinamibacterales bacterium]
MPQSPARGPFGRREFLKVAGSGGLVVTAAGLGAPGCTPPDGSVPAAEDHRWAVPPFELDEITVDGLQAGLAAGRWSAAELTERYLDRIEALDRRGPGLSAVLETNPDALDIARTLDAERASGRLRGPLHGVPILLKDNIGTADRLTTTAGSLALEGSVAPRDAFIVSRLRDAGAVLLGKANLSEWANFRSSRSSSGWSSRGGQCRNPYALHRNPCGSSSGAAAAAAANLSALAIGTETDGSIVCPASACGIVGLKPTVGLWSRSVIIPISHTQDTAGPMTRTVRDAAILLGALTGVDEADPATRASAGHVHADYTTFLDGAGLDGARLGIVRSRFGFDDRVDAVLETALTALRSAGATLVDEVEIPNQQDIGELEIEVLRYEFKAGLNAYLAALGTGAPIRTLADAIRFNEEHRDRVMPYFGQEEFLASEARGALTDAAYLSAVERSTRLSGPEGIDAAMDAHRLDALVAPTGGPAWVIDLITGDHFGGGSSGYAARAGYPNITVPAGFVMGLPIGLSLFGRAWSEPVLLRLAYAFERTLTARRAPGFRTDDALSAIS